MHIGEPSMRCLPWESVETNAPNAPTARRGSGKSSIGDEEKIPRSEDRSHKCDVPGYASI